jgi:hypothetical protein
MFIDQAMQSHHAAFGRVNNPFSRDSGKRRSSVPQTTSSGPTRSAGRRNTLQRHGNSTQLLLFFLPSFLPSFFPSSFSFYVIFCLLLYRIIMAISSLSSSYPIPYHTIPYHTILYYIISYHIILYHIILYHIISNHIISNHIVRYNAHKRRWSIIIKKSQESSHFFGRWKWRWHCHHQRPRQAQIQLSILLLLFLITCVRPIQQYEWRGGTGSSHRSPSPLSGHYRQWQRWQQL